MRQTRATSAAAYADQIRTGATNRCQQLIIDAVAAAKKGMSRREIESDTGLRSGTVTARVVELRTAGVLIEEKMRPCSITRRLVGILEVAPREGGNV